MTWAKIKATGSGRFDLRLMIEGWPYEFVTSPRITHDDNRDGRVVTSGLQYSGLVVADRSIMPEATIQATGNNFLIRPKGSTGKTDFGTLAFTQFLDPAAYLLASIDSDDASLGIIGSGSLIDSTVYHIGSEAIRVGTYPAITRAIWDTQPQTHRVAQFDQSGAVAIYSYPSTMEGRRAYLYVYGEGDDPDGDGTCIWRGVISRPPAIEQDGISWRIEAQPITQILAQSIAGHITDVKLIKIKHDSYGPFRCEIDIPDGANGDEHHVYGLHDEALFAALATAALRSAAADVTLTAIAGTVSLVKADSGWRVICTPRGADCPNFILAAGSPIIGTVLSGLTPWTELNFTGAGTVLDGIHGDQKLKQDRTYYVDLKPRNANAARWSYQPFDFLEYAYPGQPAQGLGYSREIMIEQSAWIDNTAEADGYKPWRLFVDQDLAGAECLSVSGTVGSGLFVVAGTGTHAVTAAYYVDLEPKIVYFNDRNKDISHDPPEYNASALGFYGLLGGNTTIRVVRLYAQADSVAGFVQGLKDRSIDANDGDTPFVTDADLTTWVLPETSAQVVVNRNFAFETQHTLEEVLAEEAKLAGAFLRIAGDGRIDLVGLPSYTEVTPVDAAHTLTKASIVTPGGGKGHWPGWEPQRDGFIASILIKADYDPAQDDWTTEIPYQNATAVATHKLRGQSVMEIKPYSQLATGVVLTDPRGDYFSIAQKYLAFFSNDYAHVTLQVPFKYFDILCGDVVSLTHPLIPAGDGTRGVTQRRAVCVERNWPLDPAQGGLGTLTFYMLRSQVRGYAPSALITGITHVSGNTWNITCSTVHSFNLQWSSSNDGFVLEHFTDGMYIRICQRDFGDFTDAYEITGVISGDPVVGSGTCTIVLDASWPEGATPELDRWVLEYQRNAGGSLAIEYQRRFVYMADDSATRSDGVGADRLA